MSVLLSSRDMTRLARALSLTRDESFFAALRNLLRAKLFFDTFLILIFPKDGPPEPLGTWIKDPVVAHNYPRLYTAGAYRLDPFYQYRGEVDGGGLFLLSEIAPDRFFNGDYYLHYYKETRIVGEVGLLVTLADGSTGHLSFSRREGRGTFRRKEVNCLKHHAPVLLELLRQHCEYQLARRRSDRPNRETRALDDLISYHVSESQGAALTRREAQMAGLIVQGHSNLSAALALGISRETAKVHRRNIFRKLRISSQTELFALLAELF